MASRCISVILFILALATLLFSAAGMHDHLFLFLSDHPVSGAARLAIVASLLAVSLKQIHQPQFKSVLNTFGVSLMLFGIVSLLTNSIGWLLYNYLMPLDSILLIGAGIAYSLVALGEASEETLEPTARRRIYRLSLSNKLP